MKVKDLIMALRRYYDLNEDVNVLNLLNEAGNESIKIEIQKCVKEMSGFKTFKQLVESQGEK